MNLKSLIVSLLAACMISHAASAQTHTYTIAGTGVTQCYDNSGPITCPANAGDPFYGQFHGTQPAYQNNGNGTVTDLNTGLMWIQARGTKTCWDSTFIRASQCTTGGYSDWRVPTIKELYSLIDFKGKTGQTASQCIAYLDTNYFEMAYGNTAIGERVIDAQDWSASKYTGLTMAGDSTIFGVNFVDGRIKGYPQFKPGTGNTVTNRLYVRFVRGNTSYGQNNFHDNLNGTVTDNATGLMWTKDDSGAGMNWQYALALAQAKNAQTYLGFSDWRLPNAKELQSIADYSRSLQATNSPAIDPVFNCTSITDEGGELNYPYYWSSTTHLDNMGGVYVCFGEALGWMKMPPTATFYTLLDVHGAGSQRSDPKSGSPKNYFLGFNQQGDSVYGLGPQGDVIRINNYVRLVRDASTSAVNEQKSDNSLNVHPNPVSDLCSVSLDQECLRMRVVVSNTLGNTVRETEAGNTNSVQINLSGLPKGLYIMHVSYDGKQSTRKVVKL